MDRYGSLRRLPPVARRALIRGAAVAAVAVEQGLRRLRSLRAGGDRRTSVPTPDPMPVTFFVWNAYSLGGTVRTVNHQALALAARGHDVEVVAVERRANQPAPFFDFGPDVTLTTLVDHAELRDQPGWRGRAARWLHSEPSLLVHPREGRSRQASLLTDLRLVRSLGRIRRGVVVGTRLGLNLIVARFAHPATTKVAQEHLFLGTYKAPLPDGIRTHFPKLHAVAALTAADAAHYRRHLDGEPVVVAQVPNSVPDVPPKLADPASRRIVAVGHLTAGGKGMDRLIPAFARVADRHPDWELRLVGAGSRDRLEQHATELGIRDQVVFTGPSDRVMEELSAASVLAMPSRFEAFSLVLIEGMAAGLAVVSFDCREGPRDILTPGVDGLVVPQGDLEAFAAGLDRLMRDEGLRARLGRRARRTVEERYLAGPVTERWLEVFRMADRLRVTGELPVHEADLLVEQARTATEVPELTFQVEVDASTPRGTSRKPVLVEREPSERR
jgi:glycosyltransferase involved in cell wall biosynthesis